MFCASFIVRPVAAPDRGRTLQLHGVTAKSYMGARVGLTHLANVYARRSDPEIRNCILALSGNDNGKITEAIEDP